jgi:aminoglycoside phosphotransferase (APT) family kinase protein
MKLPEEEMIIEAIRVSDLKGYTGNFTHLGGGELNYTYLLELEDQRVILRIAKHKDQNSLYREARALESLHFASQVPGLIYFDANSRIDGCSWILEEYIDGLTVNRLNLRQFNALGKLLAQVHQSNHHPNEIQLWPKFLQGCKLFGTEDFLLKHPDDELRQLMQFANENLFPEFQHSFMNIEQTLIHGDATPSNILVNRDDVALIDWELSSFSDAMAEFSTIYYEDIDYNKGMWRLRIKPEEKRELFDGYESAGGLIDEERIKFWITFDKLGAAAFLYWRIHDSGREANSEQLNQYRADYSSIVSSLEQQLLS